MAGIPLDKAYLTAIWLETLLYGAYIRWRCSERNLTSLEPRHQLYALLDLWLCAYQEKEDSVDHGGGSYLPVDAFHRPCITRIYRACALPLLLHESSILSTQRLIYGFVYDRDQPGGPAAYFSDISLPGNVAKVFIHTLNVSFFDPTG